MWYAATVLKPDAYAAQWTGNMISAFLGDHPNRWPHGWSDLKPYSTTHDGIHPFSFEEISSHVDVDFTADPARLRTQISPDGHATFLVVRLHHGKGDWFYDPNDVIARRLLEPPATSPIPIPTTTGSNKPE